MVGSGNKKNEMSIWDDKKIGDSKVIYKYKFKKDVLNLKLTEDSIVVILDNTIYLFNIKDFQLIDIIKTGKNPKGLAGITHNERKVIVYPSTSDSPGKLTIKNYKTKNYMYLDPTQKTELDYFSMSYDGLFLATLGKGSDTIRIFNAYTGTSLYELTIPDKLYNLPEKFISISRDNDAIIFSANKGEIDIFSLTTAKEEAKKEKLSETEFNLNINKEFSNDHCKKLFFKNIEKPSIRIINKFECKYTKIDKYFLYAVTLDNKFIKYKLDFKNKKYSEEKIISF